MTKRAVFVIVRVNVGEYFMHYTVNMYDLYYSGMRVLVLKGKWLFSTKDWYDSFNGGVNRSKRCL